MKQTIWDFQTVEKFPLLCLIVATLSSKKKKLFSFKNIATCHCL